MDKKELEKKLKQCKRIKLKKHAIKQMKRRGVTHQMIVEALKRSKIYDHAIEKDTISKKHNIEYILSNKRRMTITVRFKREDVYVLTAIISNRTRVDKIRRRLITWQKKRM